MSVSTIVSAGELGQCSCLRHVQRPLQAHKLMLAPQPLMVFEEIRGGENFGRR